MCVWEKLWVFECWHCTVSSSNVSRHDASCRPTASPVVHTPIDTYPNTPWFTPHQSPHDIFLPSTSVSVMGSLPPHGTKFLSFGYYFLVSENLVFLSLHILVTGNFPLFSYFDPLTHVHIWLYSVNYNVCYNANESKPTIVEMEADYSVKLGHFLLLHLWQSLSGRQHHKIEWCWQNVPFFSVLFLLTGQYRKSPILCTLSHDVVSTYVTKLTQIIRFTLTFNSHYSTYRWKKKSHICNSHLYGSQLWLAAERRSRPVIWLSHGSMGNTWCPPAALLITLSDKEEEREHLGR